MAIIIDLHLAKTLVKEFQHKNSAPGGPAIITPDNKFLKGFFLDRERLELLLSNPEVKGVAVQLAQHPDFIASEDNQFTLVYCGAKDNTDGIGDEPYINKGDIYCAPPPCPPFCTRLG